MVNYITLAPVSLSIIIPTYNRKDRLKQCLGVLLNQSYPHNKYEIIIVDDGSTDGTEEAIKNINKPNITYIKQQNKGAGAAINTGAKMANGDILAFTEDDCVVSNNWVDTITDLFNKYPQTAAFAGECVDLFYRKQEESNVPCNCDDFKKMRLNRISTYIGNGSFAIKKEIFEKIGGYDESFRVQEDCEFNIRLLKQGYEIFISPKLKAAHYTDHRIKNVFKKAFDFGVWQASLLKKHFARRLTLHFCIPIFKIDRLFGVPFPVGVFIKIYMIKIFIFLSILSFFYPLYALSVMGAIFAFKFRNYGFGKNAFFSILHVSLDYTATQAALFAGNVVGSLKNRVIIF